MKEITLSKLTLRNFKGIRDLTVEYGPTTKVFGDNATGKTSMFDAFLWLLFDKDSQDKQDFGIKTLDAHGASLHGLEHEVEGTLMVDGKPLTFRKVFSEKLTKKRGSASAEFSGHTTDYFINGVPVKQKEYKDRISDLVDEDIFKLLTSPTFFNERMDWKKRRQILLDVCGDVSDEEVILDNGALSLLPDILKDRSIDDHRKVITARRTEINKELDRIPIRIDEAERSKPDLEGLSEADVRREVEQWRTKLSLKEAEINRLQSGGEVAVQEKRLAELEAELLDIRNRAQAGSFRAVTQQRIEVQKCEELVSTLEYEIRHKEQEMTENDRQVEARRVEADKLRQQWTEENEREFVASVESDCPTCGQPLPEEQVEGAHDKALADFNRRKAERLEDITRQGKSKMEEVTRLGVANNRLSLEIQGLKVKLEDAQAAQQAAKAELQRLEAEVQDATQHPDYVAKQAECDAVKGRIVSLRQSTLDDVQRVRDEVIELRDEVRRQESRLAKFGQVETLDARIAELKQQERDLAAEYERLESELNMTEEFIRTKVHLLEDRINSKFKFARFKLFEEQINGGIAETCQTLFLGVPYGAGLNNAARINIGLDIINTLSEHYGLSAPIFVDNAEAVTDLAETQGQVIALYVSEADKKLRIESDVKEAILV